MSMITDLVKRLKDFANEYAFVDTDTMEILNDAAYVIEELSAKLQAANTKRSSQYYNGGWVPVGERLPEEVERVLVYAERDAYDGKGVFRKKVIDIGIGWQMNGRWHIGGCSGVEGIAWMPLPEPYKKEDHDT